MHTGQFWVKKSTFEILWTSHKKLLNDWKKGKERITRQRRAEKFSQKRTFHEINAIFTFMFSKKNDFEGFLGISVAKKIWNRFLRVPLSCTNWFHWGLLRPSKSGHFYYEQPSMQSRKKKLSLRREKSWVLSSGTFFSHAFARTTLQSR